MTELERIGQNAKTASEMLAVSSTELKNAALREISKALLENIDSVLEANKNDIEKAKAGGMNESLLDRLTLNEDRVKAIADSVLNVSKLPDPIGEVISENTLYNGLKVRKLRVPMGVIGVIYEARPNVTVDSAVLCLKASSAVILRGGKETINSNIELERIMREAIKKAGLPEDCITLLHDTSHETAQKLMCMREYVDLLIPRGGKRLIDSVVENATVPVIETGTGVCHVYVADSADVDMAVNIIFNAKTQRPSVCNAAETLLCHKDIAEKFLPAMAKKLGEKNVELRCDSKAAPFVPNAVSVSPDDFGREFLAQVLAVKLVDSTDEAIAHIQKYHTKHSDCIVTNNMREADYFAARIDSACVYVNASTRFTDGEQMGFGAEIGISTQKLHARGPMGLREICSYKYIIKGEGQTRC